MKIYEQPRYLFKQLKETMEHHHYEVLSHDNYNTAQKTFKAEVIGASGESLEVDVKPGSYVDNDPNTIDTVYFSFASEPDTVYRVKEAPIHHGDTGRFMRTYCMASNAETGADVRNFPELSA